jgi:hypothetical protein
METLKLNDLLGAVIATLAVPACAQVATPPITARIATLQSQMRVLRHQAQAC